MQLPFSSTTFSPGSPAESTAANGRLDTEPEGNFYSLSGGRGEEDGGGFTLVLEGCSTHSVGLGHVCRAQSNLF